MSGCNHLANFGMFKFTVNILQQEGVFLMGTWPGLGSRLRFRSLVPLHRLRLEPWWHLGQTQNYLAFTWFHMLSPIETILITPLYQHMLSAAIIWYHMFLFTDFCSCYSNIAGASTKDCRFFTRAYAHTPQILNMNNPQTISYIHYIYVYYIYISLFIIIYLLGKLRVERHGLRHMHYPHTNPCRYGAE